MAEKGKSSTLDSVTRQAIAQSICFSFAPMTWLNRFLLKISIAGGPLCCRFCFVPCIDARSISFFPLCPVQKKHAIPRFSYRAAQFCPSFLTRYSLQMNDVR